VSNSWWWTEELSETCRFTFQNKFEKLVHLVGFIIRYWEILTFLYLVLIHTVNHRGPGDFSQNNN
jgi:hypothetical protein